jgi:hypothetical protein
VEYAEQGDVRKYRTPVKFISQDGLRFSFICHDGSTTLSLRTGRRFPVLTPDQQVTIYYTATKGAVIDSLFLDDIDF